MAGCSEMLFKLAMATPDTMSSGNAGIFYSLFDYLVTALMSEILSASSFPVRTNPAERASMGSILATVLTALPRTVTPSSLSDY